MNDIVSFLVQIVQVSIHDKIIHNVHSSVSRVFNLIYLHNYRTLNAAVRNVTHQWLRQLEPESQDLKLGAFDPHVLGHHVAPQAQGNQVRRKKVLQYVAFLLKELISNL
jgi:hypothetical protein